MNTKLFKKLLWICIGLLILIVVIAIVVNNRQNVAIEENQKGQEYVYDFEQNVDLDEINPQEQNENYDMKKYNDFGIMSDYLKDMDTYTDTEGNLHVQTNVGYDVYSTSWSNEGLGQYVNEPSFGTLKKFITSFHQVEAVYQDVKMKDVENYINDLAGVGFHEIILDKKNKKENFYYYSVQNNQLIVSLNYDNQQLNIQIMEKN